jgi:Archaeal holliday junction resolvase (hjc)
MPRGGRGARQKGNRAEREAVAILRGHGFDAVRVPLSGSAGGLLFSHDLVWSLQGHGYRLEVKWRGNGFKQVYDWLAQGSDMLVIRADDQKPLLVLPLTLAAQLLAGQHSSDASPPSPESDDSGSASPVPSPPAGPRSTE